MGNSLGNTFRLWTGTEAETARSQRGGRSSSLILTCASAAIVVAGSLALAGCAVASPEAGSVSTTQPTPLSSPTSTSALACPAATSQGPWGDVIAKEQITDDFGTYCRTAVDPESTATQFNGAIVDMDSLATYGFTLADAEAAQNVAVSFVSEQGLDSSRLDNYTMSDSAWLDSTRSAFSSAAQTALATQVETFGLRDAGVIMTQSLPTPLRRNGGPRATSTDLSVDKIYATLSVDRATAVLVVRVPFTVTYRATDASIVAAAISDQRGSVAITETSLKTSTPSLFDGSDDEGLVLSGGYAVSFGIHNMTTMDSISAAWVLDTGDGHLQLDALEPEIDPSLR